MAFTPSLSLTFSDNNLPHPTLVDASLTGYSANPTASVFTGTAIVRAHRVSGVGVSVQRITTPGTLAQWEAAWSVVDAAGNYPALFYTGSKVVLVYQDNTTKAVKWRTSADDGVTWSAAGTIWTPAFYLNGTQFGISGGSTRSAFCYATGSALHFIPYVGASDTWATDYSKDYGAPATVWPSHGIWLTGDTYMLALVLNNYSYWADTAIFMQPMTYAGAAPTWGKAICHAGVEGALGASPAYKFDYTHLAKVGTDYWLTYSYNSSSANGALYDNTDTLIAVSNDGTYYTAGVRTGRAISDRLQVVDWSGVTYLFNDRELHTSTPVATVTVPTADVKTLDIQDLGATAYAEITLDNRSGTYTALPTARLGCDLLIERGAVCSGTARTVARELFAVTRYTREQDGATLTVRAYNYHRLLALWHADITYVFPSFTLEALVENIAALAGIHTATNDGAALWDIVIGEFVIQPGQSGLEALASLQDQFQFASRMSTGDTLHSLVLSAAPASDYTIGMAAGEHQQLRFEGSADRSAPDITHAEVIGTDTGGMAIATAIQSELGRQFTHRITRDVLTTNTDCATVAAAITTKIGASVTRATVRVLPAFHLQPFDAVTCDDWSADTVRYVTGLRETYNPSRKETLSRRDTNWTQTLTLADLVPTTGSPESANTVIPEGLKRSEFKRGKIVSFDSATYKALVQMADSGGAIQLYCAHYLSPAILTAGRRVAVFLFDTNNPTDGLVVATYGGAATWKQLDRLYAGDGSPGPALQMDNDGDGVLTGPRFRGTANGYPQLGSATEAERWGHIYQGIGADTFPYAAGYGLGDRCMNVGMTPTEHFRDATIPSGYTWRTGVFSTPDLYLEYAYEGDYSQFTHSDAAYRGFLAKAVDDTIIGTNSYARIVINTGINAGIRIDDGSDDNYYEARVVHSSGGSYVVRLRERSGGGAVTDTDATVYPVASTPILRLQAYGSAGSHRGRAYLVNEVGLGALLCTGSVITWTPARAGLVVDGTATLYCDWFLIP